MDQIVQPFEQKVCLVALQAVERRTLGRLEGLDLRTQVMCFRRRQNVDGGVITIFLELLQGLWAQNLHHGGILPVFREGY